MDSNKLNPRPIDAIGAAKTGGELTREQLVTRLKGAIVKEEEKPRDQRSLEQVLLYERILFELETGKPYESRKEEQLQKTLTHLASKDRKKARLRPIRRIAAVLAAVVVLVGGIELLLHREWLYGKPSDDGQQYIIQGASVDPGLIADGLAMPDDAFERITTNNFDHAVMVLGYTPMIPSWVPEGWMLDSYYAQRSETMSRFVVIYMSSESEQLLKYETRRYVNAQMVGEVIEQDRAGEILQLSDSKAYFRTNAKSSSIVWSTGLVFSNIVGPLDKDSLIKVKESVQKE